MLFCSGFFYDFRALADAVINYALGRLTPMQETAFTSPLSSCGDGFDQIGPPNRRLRLAFSLKVTYTGLQRSTHPIHLFLLLHLQFPDTILFFELAPLDPVDPFRDNGPEMLLANFEPLYVVFAATLATFLAVSASFQLRMYELFDPLYIPDGKRFDFSAGVYHLGFVAALFLPLLYAVGHSNRCIPDLEEVRFAAMAVYIQESTFQGCHSQWLIHGLV